MHSLVISQISLFIIPAGLVLGLEHNLLEDPGILTITSKTSFARLGSHHMLLTTVVNITEDLTKITKLSENFAEECRSAKKPIYVNIEEIKHAIRNTEMIINLLTTYDKKTDPERKRRWIGMFGLLKKFFVGTNDADDDSVAHRSAGVTKHAIRKFQ